MARISKNRSSTLVIVIIACASLFPTASFGACLGFSAGKQDVSLASLTQESIDRLVRRADELEDQGRYSEAVKPMETVLSWREGRLGCEHLDTAKALGSLGKLYESLSEYKRAEDFLLRALSIRVKRLGVRSPETALSMHNLASLYETLGRFDESERLYKRSLAIREDVLGPNHIATGRSLNGLAVLYQANGRLDLAEPLYQRALSIATKLPSDPSLFAASVLNNLGRLNEDWARYSKADDFYRRSLLLRESRHGPDHPSIAYNLNNLAGLYEAQGLYSKAESLYRRALAIVEKSSGQANEKFASVANNLGLVLMRQSRYKEAAQYLERALAITQAVLGPEHYLVGDSVNNLGSLHHSQGRYDLAEKFYKRSLMITEKMLGVNHPEVGISLNNLAMLLADRELYEDAQNHYRRSLTILNAAGSLDRPEGALVFKNIASLYLQSGADEKVYSPFRRALFIENQLIQREAPFLPISVRMSYANTFAGSYEVSFSLARNGDSGGNLALFSRLNRQGLLEEIEKRQAQLASLPGDQQDVALELKRVTQQLSSLSISVEQRKTLKTRQEELERQLYRLLPELKPRIVEVEQVAAVLPQGGALVEYQRYRPWDGKKKRDERFGEARYLALVLKPDASIKAVDLGLAAPIDQRIQQALMASEQKLGDAQQLWDQVGSQIINPLASALSGVQTLFISPDGELNRIPFAALPAPGGQQLLAEAMKLRLLTTGRELLDLAKPSLPSTNPALVVANPAFDQRAAAGSAAAQGSKRMSGQRSVFAEPSRQRSADLTSLRWEPLPGTAEEGAAIAALTKGKLLSGAQASASAIQASAAPQVLHIASHAFFLPDVKVKSPTIGQNRGGKEASDGPVGLQSESPLLRSGIALAGANQAKAIDSTSNTADDGYLTALEVAQLDWKGTELVVISACESGTGDIQAGEGVYGLKRAIAVAGARSSLLSLWKVDDKATAAFMESFYQKLKAGQSRADALAATQKEFREHPNKSWRHPYVWAAFQLSGDWRAIER
jgi:CHAT domain-containing protein/Tfp pilus assembly protein PilF